jgi:hypothetical protein
MGYDSSWDTDDGDDSEAFERKYEEWERRNWLDWLQRELVFPFEVKRVEDMGENPFARKSTEKPFAVGHRMQVVQLEKKKDLANRGKTNLRGLLIKVREGKKEGVIPLAEVEVTSKDDRNYWPVREYVVWSANN